MLTSLGDQLALLPSIFSVVAARVRPPTFGVKRPRTDPQNGERWGMTFCLASFVSKNCFWASHLQTVGHTNQSYLIIKSI